MKQVNKINNQKMSTVKNTDNGNAIYEYVNCFYDTQEMRDKYSKNYPTEWSKSVVIVPGRIVCTPEIGLFATTMVTLGKHLSYDERNIEIRKQMEIRNVIVTEPTNRTYQTLNK